MNRKIKSGLVVVGAFCLVSLFIPAASAECGDLSKFKFGPSLRPEAWDGGLPNEASLLRVAVSGEPIVGFWHFSMVSEGTTGIPDGVVVDSGFAQWHSDGTEITNSGGRAPNTGNFCMGTWKKVGQHYRLNHFGLSWDQNSNYIGPAQIHEDVVLGADRQSFSGSFSIDQYDQAGNLLVHIQGTISGTRVTVDSPASVAF
ncbi:MAG TPA: hypothetical protein VFB00_05690 [Terriglobales bacterium]|nr:hypothetical protein [Terriglobales bacterium]